MLATKSSFAEPKWRQKSKDSYASTYCKLLTGPNTLPFVSLPMTEFPPAGPMEIQLENTSPSDPSVQCCHVTEIKPTAHQQNGVCKAEVIS